MDAENHLSGLGLPVDSLDLTEIAIMVTEPDTNPPPDEDIGVREPRRPRPSAGSAGAIAINLAQDD